MQIGFDPEEEIRKNLEQVESEIWWKMMEREKMSGSQVREREELKREASDKKNVCMNEVWERDDLLFVTIHTYLPNVKRVFCAAKLRATHL